MYKAIIFDFFGVFCPDITLEWFKQTVPDYRNKLEQFQSICTRSDYGKLKRSDFFKEVSELACVSVPEMEKGVESQTVINTQLVTFVDTLRTKGYKIACLSNGTHEWTLKVIQEHGLSNLFDEVVLSGDLGIVKPNPDIYLETLKRLGITNNEAIFIDDREINVQAADELGITSILFQDTNNFIEELSSLLTL